MPGPSPLVGYNTNVRHKGKLYHIQTEDSGVNHPHVITHLFADGGRIIASRKTAYAEHVGASDMATIVKRLMQEQHKAMFIELRDCAYDEQPVAPAVPSLPASSALSHSGQGVQPVAPASLSLMPDAPAPMRSLMPAAPAPARSLAPPAPMRSRTGSSAILPAVPPPASRISLPPAPPSARSLTPSVSIAAGAAGAAVQSTAAAMAAVAALQGAAAKAAGSSGASGASGASGNGSSPGVPAAPRTAVPVPAPKFIGTPPPPSTSASRLQLQLDADELDRAAEVHLRGSVLSTLRNGESARRGVGRYQQTVAAKSARVSRAPSGRISTSSFGGEALRGKSLDEVILSYLSDDAGDSER